MKKLFFTAALLFISLSAAFAQFSAAYHQSEFLPFISLGYEIGDRFMPEVRFGTNIDLQDNTAFEFALLYQFVNKPDYEIYAGLAPGYYGDGSLAFPLGLNIYPLPAKRFGLHMEIAPLQIGEGSTILRGSWGIRYRFANE